MNNEQYQQIIDKSYKNYLTRVTEVDFNGRPAYLRAGQDALTKEEFINKCKIDEEFSNQWGLKIEERELSLNDRRDIARNKLNIKEWRNVIKLAHYKETYDKYNIPTRAISLTYKDKTIEVYE